MDQRALASMNDTGREKLIGKIPVRHTGDPTDIVEAATFLCSPAACYITGVVLDVDGGIGIGIGSSIR
ncbi:SDR family oxidoreductase [Streptomyces sp. RTd22]|uniref:SDR family oxidoreductase n=1 Tax=Streptomyces sp. RTd22 TaxID=1841249 RepID=UPI001F20883D|nr:SDR family oxidoreductase [Streptomyces sp. RTd22]